MDERCRYFLVIVASFLLIVSKTNSKFNFGNDENRKNGYELIFEKYERYGARASKCSDNTTQVPYISSLIKHVISNYLKNDVPVILFDEFYSINHQFHATLRHLQNELIRPVRFGRISTINLLPPESLRYMASAFDNEHLAFIIFTKNIEMGNDFIAPFTLPTTKLIFVTQTTKWHMNNFFTSTNAQLSPNLLVVLDSTLSTDMFLFAKSSTCDIGLYTHRLQVDSLGSSEPEVLTTWRVDKLTRPNVNLFPDKFKKGFNGLQLIASAAEMPPFVFRSKGQDSGFGYQVTTWDGFEVEILKLIGSMLNFTVDFREAPDSMEDSADRVLLQLDLKRAGLATGGIYITDDRVTKYEITYPHTIDCASFISLASTAIPKYRAIMGPFLWDVWLALTTVYILAMFPIAYSMWHSIRPLLEDVNELESMFWYVFGTFTNSFYLGGKNCWTKSKMSATRIFIGFYWAFTIIITAAYTGSIIAFITLPVFPDVIDSPRQILEEKYKISTLESGNWVQLFNQSQDEIGMKLNKSLDVVPDVFAGLINITKNIYSFRQYAFLGSKQHLEFIIQTNYTSSNPSKRAVFHLSKQCFLPLMSSFAFPKKALYLDKINMALIRSIEAGFALKTSRDLAWRLYKSGTSKILKTGEAPKLRAPEDRELTLDDTSGMFLLLGAGFLIATLAFISEVFHWVYKQITQREPDQPKLSHRASDYCVQKFRKWSHSFLSPSEDYIKSKQAFIISQYYNNLHNVRRPSALSISHKIWNYFGSYVYPSYFLDESETELKNLRRGSEQVSSIQLDKSEVVSNGGICNRVESRSMILLNEPFNRCPRKSF